MTQLRGANLAGLGAQSSYLTWGSSGPVSGTDYLCMTHAEVDYLIGKGCNIFRLLFAWEALQPTEYATIATTTGNYATYRDKLFDLVDYITGKGVNVLLDIHGASDAGFAGYKGVVVGKTTPSGQKVEDLLENVWWQLATKYKANKLVHYGVTNEPHDIPAATWFAAAQKVLTGIRNAGATSTVFMPGTDWTGAGTWMNNNAKAWNLVDPLNNTQVQLHMYADANAGGGATDVVSTTVLVDRLSAAVTWARSRGLKVFLGEVGLSATAQYGAAAWGNLVKFIDANNDVVSGFTFWSSGPATWWSGYQFTLCPSGGVDSAQMKLIQPSLVPAVITQPPVVTPPAVDVTALQATISQQAAQIAANLTAISKLNSDLTAEIALSDANAAKAAKYFDALNNIKGWLASVGVS